MKEIFSRPIFMKIKQYTVLFGKKMAAHPLLTLMLFVGYFRWPYWRLPHWRIAIAMLYIIFAIIYCTVKYIEHKKVLARKYLIIETALTIAYIAINMIDAFLHRNDAGYEMNFIVTLVIAASYAVSRAIYDKYKQQKS